MNNGNVDTRIKNIVNELPDVTWKQIIYEAITNSIQANATNIKINFTSNTLNLEDTNKYIDTITIEDDGDGFNEKNTKSFKEYKSNFKRSLGCKGIGRFLYLKVFEKINIESLNKRIELAIDKDIQIEEVTKNYSNTNLILENPNKKNRKHTLDYIQFEKDIKEHFIAYFKLLKDNNKIVEIEIYENDIFKVKILNSDTVAFKEKLFTLRTHNFTLSYIFQSDNINIYDGFYCAGGRVVIKNSDLESQKKFKSLKSINILYLLEGKYLDDNVNESRDNFDIYPKKRIQNDLSWNNINNEVKNQIKLIAKDNDINIDTIASENLQKAIQSRPFLGHYLKYNKDILDSEELIQNAKKALEIDKDFLRKNTNMMDSKYHQKLTIVTQSELAEYIFDRQNIIEKLKQLTDKKSLEKEIHNLFMKQNTTDEKEDYRTNHLWLFDDRFMTYDKIFSEKQIKAIFPQLSENLDRPDILSIVSNTYEKEEITDIVIIELKKADEKITPARAEEQLVDYAGYINDAYEDRKIRIWTYAFLKFDIKTERSLKNKGYNRVLTKSKYPIYYHPFNEVNTIINFVDYNALADDADNRNKTFMKILTGKTL